MILPNEDKRSIKAPCEFMSFNEKKQLFETEYPSVNCNHICSVCGWNPEEKKRRLETGKFVHRSYRTNSLTGEIVELPEGTKGLSFKHLDPVPITN